MIKTMMLYFGKSQNNFVGDDLLLIVLIATTNLTTSLLSFSLTQLKFMLIQNHI